MFYDKNPVKIIKGISVEQCFAITMFYDPKKPSSPVKGFSVETSA
jgi:hypothetical protein